MNCTLIIGLGGAGSKITVGAYQKFMGSNLPDEDKRKLVCLCFDTDVKGIEESRKTLPPEWVVKISPNLPLDAVYEKMKNRTTVQEWFDNRAVSYMSSNLNEGSGLSRMAARLAFLSAESEGKLKVINHCIEQLYSHNPYINVYVVCSFAGGTGSGIFLQTAYYIKEVLHNLNIEAESFSGYFLLSDIFCNDIICDSYVNGKMRANTYACLKELNAFSTQHMQQLDINFEYRVGQGELIHKYPPYDMCFMIGRHQHGKILSMNDCYDMVKDYLFYNAINPVITDAFLVGDNYEKNNDGERRYSLLSLAKLVYPVDDLFSYFTMQQLVDILDIWISDPKNHMRYLDYGGIALESKADEYVNCIRGSVEEIFNSRKSLNDMYMRCMTYDTDFMKSVNSDSGIEFVVRREQELEYYENAVMTFINKYRQRIVNECLFVDNETERHYLKAYVFNKDDEIYPLAAHNFLYDVRKKVDHLLENITRANKVLWDEIIQYKEDFDNPETDKVESALDGVKLAKRKTTFIRRLCGDNPYEVAIKDYLERSLQQAKNIKKYAHDKIWEEVLSELLMQLNKHFDHAVKLYIETLSEVSREFGKECLWLLQKHDDHAKGNEIYVLASKQIKKDIWQYNINKTSPVFSAETLEKLNSALWGRLFEQSGYFKLFLPKMNKEAAKEIHKVLFEDCLPIMKKTLLNNNPKYANMTIADALEEEVGIGDDIKNIRDKFRSIRECVAIEINGWDQGGVNYYKALWHHPDCRIGSIQDDLEYDVRGVASEFFIRNEIVRVDTAHYLSTKQFDGYDAAYMNHVSSRPNDALHLDKHWQKMLPEI